MKKTVMTLILSVAFVTSVLGQVCDTLELYGSEVIIETEGFKSPMQKEDDNGFKTWLYVYLRKYEKPQKRSAAYLLVYYGSPLCSYIFPDINYQVYFQGTNRYCGQTEKCCSDDGLYFRQDTYKQYVNYRVSVMYYYVREEDLELFDRILDNVEIRPLNRYECL
ncbi:MAG: hypothetical protein OSJ55_01810 [Bacteroidales bacterium]|nr:hypothetical protein [Bacteroidales bacterium]